MKRVLAFFVILLFLISTGCDFVTEQRVETVPKESVSAADSYLDPSLPAEERAADLLSRMTLEEKAGQMVQAAFYEVSPEDMQDLGIGSVLSGGGGCPADNSIDAWVGMIDSFQEGSMATRLSIPFLYGIDAVHGHNTVYQAVIYPQNIGLGAANDPEKVYEMSVAVAEEMKLTHTLWNFSPCVAVSQDPRWGRSYESYSSDPAIVTALSLAYIEGHLDAGVVPTAKHFAGDGGTVFGTGEGEYLIDRGDTQLDEETFRALHIAPYKELIDAGVPAIMASFSSINGTKMTESKHYLTEVLKEELGFQGFIVSDWEAVQGLSGESFSENVCLAINAGIDMMMEPSMFREARQAIIDGVNAGTIPIERVDDAVTRILKVKFDFGLFEDPYMDKLTHATETLGSDAYRQLAKSLVEESLVLLKNEGDILPLKSGQKIFVTGPAANDIGVQCGGWTKSWQGISDVENNGKITVGTTILEGLIETADKAGIEIITDPARAQEADLVILAVGEKPYAEYEGDAADISLSGPLALTGNDEAISRVNLYGKPVIALIVAGRQVDIDEYLSDWDACVMCYLPGTEGDGVASVLFGEKDFSGKLPFPWYADVSQIGTEEYLFPVGYGLAYEGASS